MHNYKLAIREAPLIDHYRFDEAREEILRRHNEKFKRNPNIADTREYQHWQPLIGSNTPIALSYNDIRRQLGITEIPVLSPQQAIQHWPSIFELASIYSDTDAVAVYPGKHRNPDNELLRMATLNFLGTPNIDVPLFVSGLGVDSDDTNRTYGFKVLGNDNVIATPYPFLEENCKVKWDGKEIVECREGEEGIEILVSDSQSGFRRLFRCRSGGLGAGSDGLLVSVGSGRVQCLFEPQALAKNLVQNYTPEDLESARRQLEVLKSKPGINREETEPLELLLLKLQ